MNKRQKEVFTSQLKDEQQVLKRLKEIYKKAAEDCSEKAKALLGEGETIQSKIYQARYQKSLEKQLTAILNQMESQNYNTISDYLNDCYINSFVGNMYDLHGQGIPLIIPFNQAQAVKAITLESKISEGLYTKMGKDTKVLKEQIKSDITRGISNGSDYSEIARNLNARMDIGYNKAARITRTEGHRIQSESTLDSMKAAKEKGADVVKQWDSTLDGRTRPSHRQLDGQLRELEADFTVNGKSASSPGHFGIAAEDCNCRCAVLQRAKWALDDNELKELKQRAEHFGLDKSKDFNDFKEKYLKAVDKSGESGIIKANEKTKLNINNLLEDVETNDVKNIKNILKNAPDEIISALNKCSDSFTIIPNYTSRISHYNWNEQAVKVNMAKLSSDMYEDVGRGKELYKPAYNEFFHEIGHAVDNAMGRNSKGGFWQTKLSSIFVSPTLKTSFCDSLEVEIKSCIEKNGEKGMNEILRNMPLISSADISDVFGAFSNNEVMGYTGHNVDYWSSELKEKAASECFAEMFSAEINNPQSLNTIKTFLPNSYHIFKELISSIQNIEMRR